MIEILNTLGFVGSITAFLVCTFVFTLIGSWVIYWFARAWYKGRTDVEQNFTNN